MRNLLYFFIKYNGVFIFMLLEMIALFMMSREKYNPKHNKAFTAVVGSFAGKIKETQYEIKRYWDLGTINDSLARENARLHEELRNAYFNNQVKRDTTLVVVKDTLKDSIYQKQFQYTVAQVVDNSTSRSSNYIMLNRGRKHGIEPNQGVINGAGQGILGIVRVVSDNYSEVMSLLHPDVKISAKIKRNNHFGTLVWKGYDARKLNLEAIPKHVHLEVGDSIVTSGFSAMFPQDLMIGKVDSFWLEPGSNFYTISVLLSCDLSNASYGLVVKNLNKEEIAKLKEEHENE